MDKPGRVSSTTRSWILNALATLTLLAATGLATASPAQAYSHLCGKFWGVSWDPSISYRYYSITSKYYKAFNHAQGRWDSSRAPGYFRHEKRNSDPSIEVRDGSYSWGAWARTSWSGCTAGYWSYDEVKIKFNSRTMKNLSAREKGIVAEHEVGHAYGLNHEYLTCRNPGPAAMKQGRVKFGCNSDGPWYDDVQGVLAKY